MLRTIDTWIGKHLFIPPIIKICQLTGTTQYRFAGYLFIAQCLLGLSFMRFNGFTDIFLFAFTSSMVLFVVYSITSRPEGVTSAHRVGFQMRMFYWISMIAILYALRDYSVSEQIVNALRLLANIGVFYALEIKTIPPAPTKEAKGAVLVPAPWTKR